MAYKDLKKFTYELWEEAYYDFISIPESKRGHLTGIDIERAGRLRSVYGSFQAMVDAGYDPYYISAMVIKDIVGKLMSIEKRPRIFADGNRRMSYNYARRILYICNINLKASETEGKNFRDNVRRMDVFQIEKWLRGHSIAFNTLASSSKSLFDTSRNQDLNSSSVIESKYTLSDIKALLQSGWQLHAEGVNIEVIDDARPSFYQAGWEVKSVPSSRYTGRFDMYIRRR